MIKTLLVVTLLGIQYHGFGANSLPALTAGFDSRKNAVVVKWENNSTDIKTYILQKRINNSGWSDIAVEDPDQHKATVPFYFEEKKPAGGEYYYRLKCILYNGKTIYSLAILVIIPASTAGWVMYPVPVKDLLTLEYRGAENIKGVINVFIQQSSGRVITRLRSASVNRIIKIPVDNLGKGIYDIRIVVLGNIVWNQQFVK